jgi:hypothetical protein
MNAPAPPAKRAGDLAADQPLQTFAPADVTPLICAAQPWCEHTNTRIEQLASGPHHAKEICSDCERVLRWLPKPENVARRRVNAYRVAKMLMAPGLTRWQTKFLSSVSRQQKFSPKQTAGLERMWDELFRDPR